MAKSSSDKKYRTDYFLKKIIIQLFIFSQITLFISCSQKRDRKVEHAFYYWRSSFSLSSDDFEYLKELEVNKLYIRFFDVDWNQNSNSAVPVGDVSIETDSLGSIEIVPVVFITNRSLENINNSLIQDLASKIYRKITGKIGMFSNPDYREIQLDCDWTASTKDKYFNLIKYIEKLAATEKICLSATIRLHQIKYYRLTGVPPVKRGMLMFYNMTPVSDFRTKNSIYDEGAAKKYLINFNKYPLPLDVALPAFSWGVLFRRNNIIALINDLNKEQISKDSDFKQLDVIRYMAQKDKFFDGQFIKKYDILRLEIITPEITKGAAELIASKIENSNLTVAIYHLNKELEKNYGTKDIQDCYSAFH